MPKDGLFSSWNGHSPTRRAPDRRSVTCSLTTSSMDDRALTDAMSSLLMSPAICLLRWS
jgi:hypothetical protein